MYTTAARAKTYVGLTGTDAEIENEIRKVSAIMDGYMGRTLARKEYVEEHEPTHMRYIALSHSPVVAVASVKLLFGAWGDSTLEPSDYTMMANMLSRSNGSGWFAGVEPNNDRIQVTYTSGYYLPGDHEYVEGDALSLPRDVIDVCELLLSQMSVGKEARSSDNGGVVQSKTEGGISVTYASRESTINMYKSMLSGYRVM